MRSIAERLRRLEVEADKENVFPTFTIEYADGHKERFQGAHITSLCFEHSDEIKRVTFDHSHAPSVDIGVMLGYLCGDKISVEAV